MVRTPRSSPGSDTLPIEEIWRLCGLKVGTLERLRYSALSIWPLHLAQLLATTARVLNAGSYPELFRLAVVDIMWSAEQLLGTPSDATGLIDGLLRVVRMTNEASALDDERFEPLLRAWLSKIPTRHLVESSEARRLAHYIDANLSQRLTVQSLSKISGWSARHLERTFRIHVGVSLHHYVVTARIRRASELLLKGEKVSTVIAEVGYHNKTSFNRTFRRLTGRTPGAFRRATAVPPASRQR